MDAPPNWPQNWHFPVGKNQAWPPGYPHMWPDAVTIRVKMEKGNLLTVWFEDEFGQPTDAMNGHYVEVTAKSREGKLFGVREIADSRWSRSVLIPVTNTCRGFGIVSGLEFGGDDPIVIVRVYGFDREVVI